MWLFPNNVEVSENITNGAAAVCGLLPFLIELGIFSGLKLGLRAKHFRDLRLVS
jgi:uncharacterized membrane protein